MFNKKEKTNGTEVLGKTNRIVEGTIINGNITSKTDFRFDGELVGDFKSTGKIVIGPTGNIVGDIICKNIDIEGKFTGNLQADETLNVKSTAVIEGQVTVGQLSTESGAIFNATCVMKSSSKSIPTTNGQETKQKTS